MPLNEILVTWTLANGHATNSVIYTPSGGGLFQQRFRLNTLLQALMPTLSDQVDYSIAGTGKVVSETTGQMVSTWSSTDPWSGSGTSAGQPVADATQGLLRWGTGQIVAGRFLQGRTYIPGIAVSNLFQGNLSPATVTSWSNAANAYATSGEGLAVWHRPKNGAGGVYFAATSGAAWSELAVLRRRRA